MRAELPSFLRAALRRRPGFAAPRLTRIEAATAPSASAGGLDAASVPLGMAARANAVGFMVVALVSVCLVVVVARVVQLQIAPETNLVPHIKDRVSRALLPSPRGDLQDRRGRTLAATRAGYRAFVDPVEFVNNEPSVGDAFNRASELLGVDKGLLVEKVMKRAETNERRASAAAEGVNPAPKPIRYVRVSEVLDDLQVEQVRAANIKGLHLERRSVREEPGGDAVASILGRVDVEHRGAFGAERIHDDQMKARPGFMKAVRDAWGRPMWVEADGYVVPRRGTDVKLSIDLTLQEIALEEVRRGVEDYDAQGGRCVLLDPATGEVLAMVDVVRETPDAVPYSRDEHRALGDRPHPRYRVIAEDPRREVHAALGRNRCVEDVYEPGSTFKAFMWSAVTERRLAAPDEVFNTYNGEWSTPYGRRVKDVTPQDELSWANVLVYSSNIGMVQGTSRLSFEEMWESTKRFGFGSRTKIGLPGESAGIVTPLNRFTKYTQTSMASGYEIAVTPLQMARAFSVFARNGALSGTLPNVRLTALDPARPDPTRPEPEVRTRVLPGWTADLTREVMGRISDVMTTRAARKYKDEAPMNYRMFGKSGTAEVVAPGGGGYIKNQHNSSFIAAAPFAQPRFVCLVVIDDPGPELVRKRMHYGSSTAGPVLTRIMRRALEYYGVPPDIDAAEKMAQTERDLDQGG
ncbi:MAG: peptidoglycan D,D-transpeptidase FtsI family protein [Phycisphaerales bacterium]